MIDFSITQEEYEKFQAYYNWTLLKVDTYRYGQAFLNYFDGSEEYLKSISNLGTPSDVHVSDLDHILWHERSYDKAKSMIEDYIEIKEF